MSDLIYSSVSRKGNELIKCLDSIYHQDPPEVKEFHGEWGSLAVSHNLYNGLQPLETDSHIFVVIGGPVLYFSDNRFLTGDDPTAGTRKIFNRVQNGDMIWDEDLSGPFVILSINKEDKTIECITDLMMFIPVYKYAEKGSLVLGTHVDAVARASGQEQTFDTVSLADFVLNHVVTFPYTAYEKLRQLNPASVHQYAFKAKKIEHSAPKAYWVPEEKKTYKNINQAAIELRKGVTGYINRVTEGMTEVAQFISAGEDSRVVAGMLPQKLKRDAFIFLDSMNREGEIAARASKLYDLYFFPQFRDKTHYLDILEKASDLIGVGHQYTHAHSLDFHQQCKLGKYQAVWGGYFGDSILKSMYTRKRKGAGLIPFFPQFYFSGETHSRETQNTFLDKKILRKLDQRKNGHLDLIKSFRNNDIHEWFFWPATMRVGIPYYYSNRRLFKSYEPFLSKDSIKIGAAVSTRWKLNRRLFQKAFNPFLKQSKWLFHPKGYLPFFPYWFNLFPHFGIWFYRKIAQKTGLLKGNQGPWGDWKAVMETKEWERAITKYSGSNPQNTQFLKVPPEEALKSSELKTAQKINLLQALYMTRK